MAETSELLEMTADIVSAFVSHSAVERGELPALIRQVHAALAGLTAEAPSQAARPEPPVPVHKSVTPDYLICLEDGRRFKSLKRHLHTRYGLSPDEYRRKWGLRPDYPMVAPNYAQSRSLLAKRFGLGRGGPGALAPEDSSASAPGLDVAPAEPVPAEAPAAASEAAADTAPASAPRRRRRKAG